MKILRCPNWKVTRLLGFSGDPKISMHKARVRTFLILVRSLSAIQLNTLRFLSNVTLPSHIVAVVLVVCIRRPTCDPRGFCTFLFIAISVLWPVHRTAIYLFASIPWFFLSRYRTISNVCTASRSISWGARSGEILAVKGPITQALTVQLSQLLPCTVYLWREEGWFCFIGRVLIIRQCHLHLYGPCTDIVDVFS